MAAEQVPGRAKPVAVSATPNIYQRMAAVMRDVRGVEKKSHNPQGSYKYAGHEAVTEALRDAYVKHGIVRSASVLKSEVLDRGTLLLTVQISWINVDNPEDREVVVVPGVQSAVDKHEKVRPVQVGMALSYAVKNAEFKSFALTGDNSPDPEAQNDERYDDYADGGTGGNPSLDEARHLATDYLARFSECVTEEQVRAIKEEARKDWQVLRLVPKFGEAMVDAIRKAQARIRGQRQGGR